MKRHPWLAFLTLAAAIPTPATHAAILSFSGRTSAQVQEFADGSSGQADSQSLSFPSGQSTLPLQVVARVTSEDNTFPSAAAVAAQFADPTTSSGANPEEFAINLTLNSISPSVHYEATAQSREIRELLFSAGELSDGEADGDAVELLGRFFIDGALTLIAADSGRDLSGAGATLRMTVVQSSSSTGEQTVFSGEVALNGQPDGRVSVSADGDFPTSRLILTDLAALNPEFGAFRVLIIPRISIDFDYTVVVGEPLTLTATVDVEAANVPDNVGVAVVLGSPTDTLDTVLGSTRGPSLATKVIQAIRSERQDPTGELAFPETTTPNLFELCGLFGFESLLGCALLGGLKAQRFTARRRIQQLNGKASPDTATEH